MLLCTHLLGGGTDSDAAIFGGIDPRCRIICARSPFERTEPHPYITIKPLTRRFLPPDVRTAEGDELRLCTAKLEVSNPKELNSDPSERRGELAGR